MHGRATAQMIVQMAWVILRAGLNCGDASGETSFGTESVVAAMW
jgi:hypothetical protein